MDISIKKLINLAYKAKKYAYAPYSKFKVGAALLTKKGNIYTGCNIENSSYGLTICAERVALFKALSSEIIKNNGLLTLAIVTDSTKIITPCGACLQTLTEFAPNLIIYAINSKKNIETKKIQELLPIPFKK